MNVKESFNVSYIVEAEVPGYDAIKLCNIAAKVDIATACWALRLMVPSMTLTEAYKFINNLCDRHPV